MKIEEKAKKILKARKYLEKSTSPGPPEPAPEPEPEPESELNPPKNGKKKRSRALFGFTGAHLVKKSNPEKKCWHLQISYCGNITPLGMYHDPLTPYLLHEIILKEISQYKPLRKCAWCGRQFKEGANYRKYCCPEHSAHANRESMRVSMQKYRKKYKYVDKNGNTQWTGCKRPLGIKNASLGPHRDENFEQEGKKVKNQLKRIFHPKKYAKKM